MKLAMELRKAGHNFQFMATEHAIREWPNLFHNLTCTDTPIYPKKISLCWQSELNQCCPNLSNDSRPSLLSSYNFMAAEGRVVAAALIPPRSVREVSGDDAFAKGYHTQKVGVEHSVCQGAFPNFYRFPFSS